MAISSFLLDRELPSFPQHAILPLFSLLLGLTATYLYLRPVLARPKDAPPLLREDWPLIGTLRFFSGRWDFFKDARAHFGTAGFSFHVGNKHVVGVSGDEARKTFFESKELHFSEGYGALLAGLPSPPKDASQEATIAEDEFDGHFNRRILALLKGDVIRRNMPNLMADTRRRLELLAQDPRGVTDPFESIYKIVFQLTMRTVACNEIAEDPALLDKTLHLFEAMDKAATPAVVMYPSLPTPAKLKRMWAGAQLYMIFKKIVDERQRADRRDHDALQFMMDHGDDIRTIITCVLGALFAGQLNSGINAAWVIIYLSQSPEWQSRARAEVEAVASKYNPDASLPLPERLACVPVEAWESEFQVLELCLKDSIRIQMAGAAFRRNVSGRPMKVGESIVPAGGYVMYHIGDIHQDPEVYPEPLRWDPSRYLPERAEDKKKPLGYLGWGLGRHPCPGQRFARLESNIITAFFLAYFDFEYADKDGNTEGVKPPPMSLNGYTAHKPAVQTFLKFKKRAE